MDGQQAAESGQQAAPPSTRAPPQSMSAQAMLGRYRWEELMESEKDALRDCIGIASTRAGIGLGAVLTIAAVSSSLRKGASPFPKSLRYGSLVFFSFAGAYTGFMSAGKMYAQRILSVPNSRLADDLRIVIGDWQSRNAPIATEQEDALPNEPLPTDAAVGIGRGKNEIIARDPKDVRREQRMNQTSGGTQRRWSDRLGLTNKTDRE